MIYLFSERPIKNPLKFEKIIFNGCYLFSAFRNLNIGFLNSRRRFNLILFFFIIYAHLLIE